ncbi:S41 family peptidase [Pedobacter frigoris]|uniref:S41 family peptidase n=1 Tax=Pedobacter frigoris TaxID=2571272 RepID=UPI00292CA98D|nr:S41 family peptidase [Pedobacter frigoris]
MKSYSYKNYCIVAAMMVLTVFGACKKNKTQPKTDEPAVQSNTKQTPTTNRRELTNDSLFLYAKEIYFWNTSLPTYDAFEPRKYTTQSTDLANYELNLFNIVKSSGSADYVSTSPYPKYSFIDDITTRNPAVKSAAPDPKASVDLEGNGNDMGIYDISAVGIGNSMYRLYILAVSKGSPADLAQITRGANITKINGTSIGSASGGQIAASEVSLINATIFGNPTTLQLEGVKTDGATFSVTLQKAAYKSNPIYKTNVITAGTKKIGYLAYARFSNSENSISALNDAFADFTTKGVTDLVIDLRFNGGGYVSTARHLINLIAPLTATGTMYVEHYNNNLKNRKQSDQSILSHQPLLDENDKVQYENGKMVTYADIDFSVAKNTEVFSKVGGLTGVKNVVFIVTGSTASASELVINSLKPHMTVKLVGQKSYGKPIGFFPIRLENRYEVYFSLFESKNSLGQGEYYSGMTPDYVMSDDLGTFDFGNPQELYLKQALNYLAPNITTFSSGNKVMSVSAKTGNVALSRVEGEFKNGERGFVGMIETKYKIRK